MRVWVDEDACTGCGICVDKCPSIFELEDGVAFAATGVVPISEEDRVFCRDLIYNREQGAEKSPLMRFIDHFSARVDGDDEEDPEDKRPEENLHEKIVRGEKDGIEDILAVLLDRYPPLDIVNQILVPAMRHVGELFGKGELLLPFVLQSAETMKAAVRFLEPRMEGADQHRRGSIVLATVKGDVHDIGKNLVDIILTNNGFTVHNLGIKVGINEMIEKADEVRADAIGMSGLLVKSTVIMSDNLDELVRRGRGDTPVLLGSGVNEESSPGVLSQADGSRSVEELARMARERTFLAWKTSSTATSSAAHRRRSRSRS